MEHKRNYVILFTDYYFAVKGERVLQGKGVPIQLVPTPKELSYACGLCILAYEVDIETILTVLAEEKITHSGVYRKEESQFVKEHRRL